MNKKSNRLKDAILETANVMLNGGMIAKKSYEKITMRYLKKESIPKMSSMTSREGKLKN
ncbi:MAG: hypothetical protein ACSNEK_09515 [Parachlamydiaceae bacterium]